MASSLGILCTSMVVSLVFMISAPPLEAVKEFKVGDDLGWSVPSGPNNSSAIYNQWAVRNRFRIGDSLVFEYKNDSVLLVDKWGYYHCDASKPIIAFNNGNSTVKLDRSGFFYFSSGAPDHCKKGQRMIVDVMSRHRPSPSPAVPPEPFTATSPTPAQSAGVLVSVAHSSLALALIATAATLLV
ncbi:Phytocyanin domain containing protein [Parasponia andersonii]|uniref:Phytocyanin domain containing protein n=1 Tax=Parasponia andersonii TaxID=3476 RepID=A0A2P5BZS5_PARAD|nr:Phytocyanin domain containing protein [Parasponia andersonii]